MLSGYYLLGNKVNMEARELRIGNLIRQVDYVTGETICIRTVTSINKEGYLNVKSKGIENNISL